MGNKLNGTDGLVKVGLVTVANLNKWDMTDQVNKVTGRAFGETVEKAEAGARSVTGTLSGFYDPADTNGQAVIVSGAKVALNLYPSGSSAGAKYKSISEALIDNVQIGSENDQYVSFTASFHANEVPSDETVV